MNKKYSDFAPNQRFSVEAVAVRKREHEHALMTAVIDACERALSDYDEERIVKKCVRRGNKANLHPIARARKLCNEAMQRVIASRPFVTESNEWVYNQTIVVLMGRFDNVRTELQKRGYES